MNLTTTLYIAKFKQNYSFNINYLLWTLSGPDKVVVRESEIKQLAHFLNRFTNTTGLPTCLYSKKLNYKDEIKLHVISIPKIT